MPRFLTFCAIALALCLASNADGAPKRSVSTIAWAIGQANGSLSKRQRIVYAKALKRTSEKYNFDSFTGVALIWHESRWIASSVGDGGAAIGLGQIHYRNLCKGKGDEACERKRVALLNPVYAIQVMGQMIDVSRRYCRRVTGKPALLARALHAYGFNQRENLKCNMKKIRGQWRDRPVPTELQRIIRYRRQLIHKLQRKRRSSRRRGRRRPRR